MENTKTATKTNLTISHLTGRPVRPLDKLYERIGGMCEIKSWIKTIDLMVNSFAFENDSISLQEGLIKVIAIRTLFVELLQNIYKIDLEVMSKTTGETIRSIRDIEKELRNVASLDESLELISDLLHFTIYKHDGVPGSCSFFAIQLRQFLAEIFINLHKQKGQL